MSEECEHEYEWIDDSFDHAFGVQQQGYYECSHCGDISEDSEPPRFEDDFID